MDTLVSLLPITRIIKALDTDEHMEDEGKTSTLSYITPIVYLLLTIWALYLSYKCNKGFDLGGVLGAICCTPCYIAFKLSSCTAK